jgi:hypothetical protein
MILTGENRDTGRDPRPSATLSSPTLTGLPYWRESTRGKLTGLYREAYCLGVLYSRLSSED